MGTNEDAVDQAVGPRHISRRAVVRTGVTVAWAVPAIQVVAAAPALALSNDLSVSATGSRSGKSVNAGLTVTLGNTSGAKNLKVTVTSSSGSFKIDAPSGWTVDNAGFASSHTWTYSGTSAATGFSTTLHFDVWPATSPTITVSATADNKNAAGTSYKP